MNASSKVVFVCVPGAFCPGIYFSEVTRSLESHGFEAIYVDLPSMDKQLRADGQFPGMDDDSAYVRSVCSSYIGRGQSIVLVGNSYGGVVISEACKGIVQDVHSASDSVGVCHLLLLASLLMTAGMTVTELLAQTGAIRGSSDIPEANDPVWNDPGDPTAMGRVLCGSLPVDQQLKYGSLMKAMSSRTMFSPATYEGWKAVPTTMVVSGLDAAIPIPAQDQSFAMGRSESRQSLNQILLKDADHVSMLTNPEDVVKICLDIANSLNNQVE